MNESEIRRYAASFRRGLLGRSSGRKECYKVCAPLQSLLSIDGVETFLIEGEVCYHRFWIGHYWLRFKNGRILDPTAEQFRTKYRKMPQVYIGIKPIWYRELRDGL